MSTLNPTVEQILSHRSIRRYSSEPIPRETIELIVATAQRSSTSSNLQAYSVVAVTDINTREKLSTLCGNQKHIAQAPVFLAWSADLNRLDRVCSLRGYKQNHAFVENFLIAAVDAAIAMQSAAIAAESLGLGICYIGSIRNHPEEVVQLLGLPDRVFPISGMTLGIPAEEPIIKPRLPLNEVLHWGKYDQSDQDQHLSAYDQTMIETGIYHGRRVPIPGNIDESEDYGWLEHTARRVSQVHRPQLRQAIQDNGFELK
jgi:FMN reductase (NADPH)